jgi:hypothetical protein
MDKQKIISLGLEPDLHRMLIQEADRRSMTISRYCRERLRECVESDRKETKIILEKA